MKQVLNNIYRWLRRGRDRVIDEARRAAREEARRIITELVKEGGPWK
jgi:hypothetical protein